ncbi:MAG: TRAP transporter small permease subunit [Rhizobiaceae bacterium]|nr:TRAP transporter small permease subunit [Rhizobiaceae bacterium]
MRRFLTKAERLVDSASLFSANLAAIILLVLVVLTCIDVIGRYFFNSPLVGAVELVQICMGMIVFFSFPIMFLRNDHVVVDLVPQFGRGRLGWAVAIIFLLITVYVAVTLGDRVMDYASRAMEDGDITEYLAIPRYPVVGLITAAIFCAAAVSLLRALVLLSRFNTSDQYDADSTESSTKS